MNIDLEAKLSSWSTCYREIHLKETLVLKIAPIDQHINWNDLSLPTRQDKELYSQVHYFLRNRGYLPFSQFNELEFRTILTSMRPMCQGFTM